MNSSLVMLEADARRRLRALWCRGVTGKPKHVRELWRVLQGLNPAGQLYQRWTGAWSHLQPHLSEDAAWPDALSALHAGLVDMTGHLLLCESSIDVHRTDARTLLASLPPQSVDLVYADPPFGTGKKFYMVDGSVAFLDPKYGKSELRALDDFVRLCSRVLTSAGVVIVQIDTLNSFHWKKSLDRHIGAANEIATIVIPAGSAKPTARPHSFRSITPTHNYLHVYGRDIRRVRFRRKMWPSRAGGDLSTLWSHLVTRGFISDYPTEKSMALMRSLASIFIRPRMLCCEPFGGSGTFSICAALHQARTIYNDGSAAAVDLFRKRISPSGPPGLRYRPIAKALPETTNAGRRGDGNG